MDIQRKAEGLLDQAKEILKRDGSHAPIVIVYGQRENSAVLLEPPTPDAKYGAMYVLGLVHSPLGPQAVAFICEAWMSTQTPPEGVSVGEMPDRQEALCVAVQTRRLSGYSIVLPFVKVGEEVVFGEPVQGSDVDMHLFEYFWRGVLDGEG